jgi:hypothetical protein
MADDKMEAFRLGFLAAFPNPENGFDNGLYL